MKPEKYRELTREELERNVRDLRQELFNLRFRVSSQKLDNPLKIRELRREIARILTIMREEDMGISRLPGTGEVAGGEQEARDAKKG